jgi:2,3-bisphosphoglycerate-independent phosphoglycerate mutase
MVSPETGKPDTEHSTNPVPFILFSNSTKDKLITFSAGGNLSSVAPTILDFMGIEKPESMSAKSLINR